MADIVQQVNDALSSTVGTPAPLDSYAKRAQVAVTGGLVTAAGLVLIPAPVPLGCVVTAYGVSILATEFEGAQDALDTTKHHIENKLERLAENLHIEDESSTTIAALHNNSNEQEEKQPPGFVEEDYANREENQEQQQQLAMVPYRNGYDELCAIMKSKEPLIERTKKIWQFHKQNVRKVSSFFITRVLLPALRNFKPGGAAAAVPEENQELVVQEEENHPTIDKNEKTTTASATTTTLDEPCAMMETTATSKTASDDETLAERLLQKAVTLPTNANANVASVECAESKFSPVEVPEAA